jgi:hypothetical protein
VVLVGVFHAGRKKSFGVVGRKFGPAEILALTSGAQTMPQPCWLPAALPTGETTFTVACLTGIKASWDAQRSVGSSASPSFFQLARATATLDILKKNHPVMQNVGGSEVQMHVVRSGLHLVSSTNRFSIQAIIWAQAMTRMEGQNTRHLIDPLLG